MNRRSHLEFQDECFQQSQDEDRLCELPCPARRRTDCCLASEHLDVCSQCSARELLVVESPDVVWLTAQSEALDLALKAEVQVQPKPASAELLPLAQLSAQTQALELLQEQGRAPEQVRELEQVQA